MSPRATHGGAPQRVVLVAAEATRVTRVGGLADATTGLVRNLRRRGIDVHLVLPDYAAVSLDDEIREQLPVPASLGPTHARHGTIGGLGPVSLISSPGIAREHPYVDPRTGSGWADNNERFLAFCAGAAALIDLDPPGLVHLHDWHAAAVASWLEPSMPTVVTVHNLAHQGAMSCELATRLGARRAEFERDGGLNALAGAIRLADIVLTVSPSYAEEITHPTGGEGLDDLLRARGDTLIGVRNGIEPDEWQPDRNLRLPTAFDAVDLHGKAACRRALLASVGLEAAPDRPVIAMIARLDAQKGIDIALALVPGLEAAGARLVLVGDGDPSLSLCAQMTEQRHRGAMRALRFDDRVAHLVVAGSDLLLMPSRFEPCGLPQMHAMSNGTIPVVTRVGGLRDTVVDADLAPATGTGFSAPEPSVASFGDALARAGRAWHDRARWTGIQQRAMAADWSWRQPTETVLACYARAVARGADTLSPRTVIDLRGTVVPDLTNGRAAMHAPEPQRG